MRKSFESFRSFAGDAWNPENPLGAALSIVVLRFKWLNSMGKESGVELVTRWSLQKTRLGHLTWREMRRLTCLLGPKGRQTW